MLNSYIVQLLEVTQKIMAQDFRGQSLNACDYLDAVAYILYGYMWYKNLRALDTEAISAEFREAKRLTARYYFERILPKTKGLFELLSQDTASVDSLAAEYF